MPGDALNWSQVMLPRARARLKAGWASQRRRRPPGGPDAAGEPLPVEPPRRPTLSRGAAAEVAH